MIMIMIPLISLVTKHKSTDICVSCTILLHGMIVVLSNLVFQRKELYVSHLHDYGMYVFIDRRLSYCSALFTRKNVFCVDCVRPSVCSFVFDYIPTLHR